MKFKPDNDAHCFKHAFSHPSSEPCPYCRIAELEKRVALQEDHLHRMDSLTTPCDAPLRMREQRARHAAEKAQERIRCSLTDIFAEMEKAKETVQPIIDHEAASERLQPIGEGWRA